ncbi:MAG: transposase [Christensenellaceae bacterium]|nr:transposase [Christensenellaceae bacterium]
MKHYWNYLKRPKSNAYIERFNRTIKEQFIYKNQDCISDCDIANKKIKEWLLWYNTKRYHKTLNYQTPLLYSLALISENKSNICDILQCITFLKQKIYN